MKKIKGIIASVLIAGSIGFVLGSVVTRTEGTVVSNYQIDGYKYSVVNVNGNQIVIDGWKEVNKKIVFYSF